MANTKKLTNISEQKFLVMDFCKEKLTAKIAVTDFNDLDIIQLTQHDICEAAKSGELKLIDDYYHPVEEGGNFSTIDFLQDIDFVDWFSNIDPCDTEKLFAEAIATKVDIQLDAILKDLFQQTTVKEAA